MAKIILEPANNGVIKKVEDTNHGGANNQWSSIDVYQSDNSKKLIFVINLFYDLCDDLGINLGNKFEDKVITIREEWGSHYKPSSSDVKKRIGELEAEIELLKK
jgi:hypothetical protein